MAGCEVLRAWKGESKLGRSNSVPSAAACRKRVNLSLLLLSTSEFQTENCRWNAARDKSSRNTFFAATVSGQDSMW